MEKKTKPIDIIILQLAVGIYSINTVISKYVGTSLKENGAFAFKTIALFFLEVCILGVYAIIWQQLIGKFQLSIAYANKAMALMWSLLWSVLIFKDTVTPKQFVGVLIVIAGIVILNTGKEEDSCK